MFDDHNDIMQNGAKRLVPCVCSAIEIAACMMDGRIKDERKRNVCFRQRKSELESVNGARKMAFLGGHCASVASQKKHYWFLNFFL